MTEKIEKKASPKVKPKEKKEKAGTEMHEKKPAEAEAVKGAGEETASPAEEKADDYLVIPIEGKEIEKVLKAPGEEVPIKVISESVSSWVPKTKLGKDVVAGKYASLDDILIKGEMILEAEVVDALIPELMQEIVYIGGSPGKGGGIRRTASKMTARMHKSGRRFKLSAMAIVGNGDGIVGVGRGISREHRAAMEKALRNAKLEVIRIRRGCGSWECGCDGRHSIPFKVSGQCGSVRVELMPAPKGVGLVASEETKKILRLAGIKDIWVKAEGKTETRSNLVIAVFEALKNLNRGKGDL